MSASALTIVPHKPAAPEGSNRSPNIPPALGSKTNAIAIASNSTPSQPADSNHGGSIAASSDHGDDCTSSSLLETKQQAPMSYAELLELLRPKILAIRREEVGCRREVLESEVQGFEDCKIVAAQMISAIKKFRDEQYSYRSLTTNSKQKGRLPPSPPRTVAVFTTNRELMLLEQQEDPVSDDVWFPTSPPRGVPQKSRFRSKFEVKLLAVNFEPLELEEAQLREWVLGLEAKGRGPIERSCVHCWILLTSNERIETEEEEHYAYLLAQEDKMWKHLAKKEFKTRPLDLDKTAFINLMIGKGLTVVAQSQASRKERMSLVEYEATLREEMMVDERNGIVALYTWLWQRYEVRLFGVIRLEDWDRVDIFEQEAADRFRTLCRIGPAIGFQQPMVAAMAFGCMQRMRVFPQLPYVFPLIPPPQ